MRSPAELTEAFRARGLKITPQRQCIFRILYATTEHPTAEAVHAIAVQEMPMMSLRTVYQTLNDLAAMGELVQLRFDTGPSRFDPNSQPHHHVVCTSCGRIHDLHAAVEGIPLPVGVPAGFEVKSTEIVYRGSCRACRSAPSRPGSIHKHSKHSKEARERNG